MWLLDRSDEEAVITSLRLSAPEEYLVASSQGAGVSNRVRAKLTARYGTLTATARQIWVGRIPSGASGSGEVIVVDPAHNRAVPASGNDV